jgi:hypothetical protein
MASDVDDKFYDRNDAHIHLSNEQLADISRGKVSASIMYSLTRFNAWVSASNFTKSEEMAAAKAETMEYIVYEYRKMLDENLSDYIANSDSYMVESTDEL